MLEDESVEFFGMFDNDELVAVMRLFDFETNLFGKIVKTSGIGFLGVSLLHKKKKVARDMLKFYEEHYRERNMPIGSLLPFRPDFYKKMGYGFGTKINKLNLPAERFPIDLSKPDIRKIQASDFEKIHDCHDSFVMNNHGMNRKLYYEKIQMLKEKNQKIVGIYDEDENIKGYTMFEFYNGKSDNYTINNIAIKELIYDSSDTLRQLLGFYRKQEDQVQYISLVTSDEAFHFLFDDPRNDTLNYIPFGYLESNTQGIGMMYKIFDVEMAFRQCEHRNYNNQDINIKLVVEDAFIDKNISELTLGFVNGKVNFDVNNHDVEIKLSISDFSSLFMGVISPSQLYRLGLIEIEDKNQLYRLDLLFYNNQKPQTNTDF